MKIGTRGSDLALAQANVIVEAITKELKVKSEIIVIKTRGDRIIDRPLRELEGRGYFTKEIEDALLDGRIDVAVHSFKDMPSKMPEGLVVAAVTERENPCDLLIIKPEAYSDNLAHSISSPPVSGVGGKSSIIPLRRGSSVGTSSVRRSVQLKSMRPDLEIIDLRGNVPTRLRKLADGQYDAVMIAQAGVNRLRIELTQFRTTMIDPTRFVPAAGQGALVVQMREDDPHLDDLRAILHHETTGQATSLERKVMDRFGGGCGLPLGVYARSTGIDWEIHGFWGGDPEQPVWGSVRGFSDDNLVEALFCKLHVLNK